MNDRHDDVRAKREQFLRLSEAHAERALNDQRWNVLRTPANRKRLVIATFATLLVYAVANYLEQPVLALVGIVAYFGFLFAMRTATRTIPDLPDEIVDERMRAVRGVVYRYAYVGTIAVFTLVIVLEIALRLAARAGAPFSALTGDQWFDLMFVAFFATLAIPSAIFLWIEPEV